MNKIKGNNRQTLWEHNNNYYICSTSLDESEVMVFEADADGNIVSWMDLYVDYDFVTDHDKHMQIFGETNGS